MCVCPKTETDELSICLIYPRFEPSHYDFSHALEVYPGKKRCQMIVGSLPTLAGLIDRRHKVTLLDENLEDIDYDEMDSYDIVGVTGMIVQEERMREILAELKNHDTLVVVGGPLNSCDETLFRDLCDVSFVGEADETWPEFVEHYARTKTYQKRYKQEHFSDLTKLPMPRYDLVDPSRYVSIPLQFSRGCPFLCEFCDITILFGRNPRVKKPEQFIAEIDAVYQQGFRVCFVVDDNFIGKKREAKAILKHLIEWQKAHDYPMNFSTEASVNLADDDEMMDLMVEAGFTQIFIGIESPRKASLEETRKFQNVRGDSLLEKIRRVNSRGLIVLGGFIVGFDEDDKTIFDDQFDFITEAEIGLPIIGILKPIPTTPLHKRLEQEGRLRPEDSYCAFEPKRMSRQELKDGHMALMKRVYAPDHFFERILASYRRYPQFKQIRSRINRRTKTGRILRRHTLTLIIVCRLFLRVHKEGYARVLIPAYWRAWRQNQRIGKGAIPASGFVDLCLKHWHVYKLAHETQIKSF